MFFVLFRFHTSSVSVMFVWCTANALYVLDNTPCKVSMSQCGRPCISAETTNTVKWNRKVTQLIFIFAFPHAVGRRTSAVAFVCHSVPTPLGRRNEIVIGERIFVFLVQFTLWHIYSWLWWWRICHECGCQSAPYLATHCRFYGKMLTAFVAGGLRSVVSE